MNERLGKTERIKLPKVPSVPQMVILSELADGSKIAIWRDRDGIIDFYNYGIMDPALNKKTVESLLKNEWIYLRESEKGPDSYLISREGTDVFEKNKERVMKILGELPWRDN